MYSTALGRECGGGKDPIGACSHLEKGTCSEQEQGYGNGSGCLSIHRLARFSFAAACMSKLLCFSKVLINLQLDGSDCF